LLEEVVDDPRVINPGAVGSDPGHGDSAASGVGGRMARHAPRLPSHDSKRGWPLAAGGDDLSLA